MHHSFQLSQSEDFECSDFLLPNASKEMVDYININGFGNEDPVSTVTPADRSLYWRDSYSDTLNDQAYPFSKDFCSVELFEEELFLINPQKDGKEHDPFLSSSWSACNQDTVTFKDAVGSDKVIVEQIRKDGEDEVFSSVIGGHLEEHSYCQNEPIVDSDNSNSANSSTSGSASASESEYIDVEYIDPEPVRPIRKIRKNIQATLRSKTRCRKIKSTRSYHNELERKRRMQQRECLDNLRCKLNLSKKAPKMLILNTARETVLQLTQENDSLLAAKKKELARHRMLSSWLQDICRNPDSSHS